MKVELNVTEKLIIVERELKEYSSAPEAVQMLDRVSQILEYYS